MKRNSDITGRRFGKLTAVHATDRRTASRNVVWRLVCDCGGVRFCDTGELAKGKAVACIGCRLGRSDVCSYCGCGERVHAGGLCNRHYKRLRGTPSTSHNIRERLELKTRMLENGCIEWTGAVSSSGYGTTTVCGKHALVHRLAWELVHGHIAAGMVICHKCDNPVCVNVDHLFIGTQRDNVRDAWANGRGRAPWQTMR